MHNIKLLFSKIKKTYIIYALLCMFVFTACTSFCVSYYTVTGEVTATSNSIVVLDFAPKVNNNGNFNQSINLANTISNGKTLAPGAQGSFDLNIDFTKVYYDAHYVISFDGTNIPTNLHFYTDSSRTNSLTTITGTKLESSSNQVANNTIYWEWEYSNTQESNANDSLYMNQNIVVPFTIAITKETN